jgi:hypothetical protein
MLILAAASGAILRSLTEYLRADYSTPDSRACGGSAIGMLRTSTIFWAMPAGITSTRPACSAVDEHIDFTRRL